MDNLRVDSTTIHTPQYATPDSDGTSSTKKQGYLERFTFCQKAFENLKGFAGLGNRILTKVSEYKFTYPLAQTDQKSRISALACLSLIVAIPTIGLIYYAASGRGVVQDPPGAFNGNKLIEHFGGKESFQSWVNGQNGGIQEILNKIAEIPPDFKSHELAKDAIDQLLNKDANRTVEELIEILSNTTDSGLGEFAKESFVSLFSHINPLLFDPTLLEKLLNAKNPRVQEFAKKFKTAFIEVSKKLLNDLH